MPHFCLDELRLLVAVVIFATPWLGWLRSWWHHRRRHVGCVGDGGVETTTRRSWNGETTRTRGGV